MHGQLYWQHFFRRFGACLLLFFLIQGLFCTNAQATHFRYGTMTWRPLPSDPTGRTIEYRLTMGFRYTYFPTPRPTVGSTFLNSVVNGTAAFNFGDGTNTATFSFTTTSVNTTDDFVYADAVLVKTYATAGNYTAFISSNARLTTLSNNASGNYRIATTVNAGTSGNLSPVSTLPPVVNLPLSSSTATVATFPKFTVPASDPNNDNLTFSLATAADFASTTATGGTYTFTQPTGLSITSAGVATFDTRPPAKAVDQFYNAIIKVSDGNSFILVDFLIRIVPPSDPPVFVYGGVTPANNSTIQSYVGCPVSFNVQATDTDPTSNTITLQGVGLPPGTVFSPVTGTNTVTSPFTFNPTTEGTSVVSFIAQDNVGNQAITSVTLRILQPTLSASASAVCVGTPIGLTATPGTSVSGTTNYTFRGPNGVIGSTSSSNTATVSGLTAGVYSFSVTTSNANNFSAACTATVVTSVTVEGPPTVTLTSSRTITCATTSAVLRATSSPPATSFAFSGPGFSQTSSVDSAVVSRGGTYTVVATTANGCVSSATANVVSNTVSPAAPGISLIQPSCTLATGTISVTAPTGSDLTYSLNGTTYTSSSTFSGVSPGTYSVTVRNTTNGCISPATSVTINAQPPTPAAPGVSLVQPSCTLATGTISVTAPTGAGLTYSIDGANYTNTSGIFTGVASGTYAVTVRNSSGCTSAPTSVTINAQPPTPATPGVSLIQPSCTLATGTISVTAPTGTGLTYSIDGTNYTNTTGIFTGVVSGTYTVTVRNSSGCTSAPTSVTINAQPPTPAAPSVSLVQPSCTLATGTISVTAPTSAGLTYSINGSTYSTSPTFTGVTSGTYAVTVRNTNGCTSAPASVTINAQPPTPAAPGVSLIQPSCTLATGTISVTAPTGAGLTYSIDGANYTSSPTFTGVTSGTYAVTVRNSSGCTSAPASVTINAQPPTPATPGVSLIQPSCTLATGTISVTAPTGAGLTYSIDGANYANTTGIFTGVASGTYAVTVRNTNGCTSAPTSVSINAQPPTPAAPSVSLVQPSCTLATGTISVTAPTGTGLTYSIDGANYTSSPTFTGVASGTYAVTVRNTNGCTSAPASVTINAQPPTPAEPSVSLVQPSCTLATGTISVTAPTGAGLTYSINSSPYSTSPTFTGVTSGTYAVTVRNSSGCTSAPTSVTINAQPPTPAAPGVSLVQPSCTLATGTISVTAPTGAGLTYSIDGANYTSSPTFTGVTSGTYAVTVRNSSGCTSAPASVTINAQPPTPATPGVSLIQPSCTLATGTISVTAPTGAGLTYSIDGANYANISGIFTGVASGTYAVTVRNSSGCTSAPTSVTINVQPPTPATPTAQVTSQPSCTLATGTISVTNPLGTGLTYSIDGTNYTSSPTFTGVTSGTYAVTVRNVSGCTSAATSVTVATQPISPTLTVNSATTCAGQSTTLTVNGCTGGTLLWSTGDQTTSIIVRPLASTTYSVTCTNAVGCSATVSTTVTIRPTPAFSTPPVVSAATCSGATPTASAQITFSTLENTDQAGLVAGSTYANGPAYGSSGTRTVSNGTVTFTGLANPVMRQTYTIRLFSAAGTCTTDVTVQLDPVTCRCPPCAKVSVASTRR